MKKKIILLLIVMFSSPSIYGQKFETETKVYDFGFVVCLDSESYPSIPISFEIPSNYKERYEKYVEEFAYVYKSGEIICFYSDWTRKEYWPLGVHEVNEKQADRILEKISFCYLGNEVDLDKKPWLYRDDRRSIIISLGNSVCLLFNIKKKNVEIYTQLIKESFKELPKSSIPQAGTVKKQTRRWKSNTLL